MTMPDASPDKEALKPCPFCGATREHDEVTHSYSVRTGTWRIVCDECFGSTGAFVHEDAAIAAWNRRAP
jgi:Lar family restriction alleviation protein